MDPAIILFGLGLGLGLGVGVLVGTTGMGGGSLMMPLGITSAGSGTLIAIGLIVGFRLSPHRVVGTDVAHAAVLLWVAAAAHLVSGNIDFALAGTILLGSVPGVWLGANLSTRLPQEWLRIALATVMLASGLSLVSKAGVDLPVGVLIGAPLAAGTFSAALLRRRAVLGVSPS
jgi:hypothetical protein